MDLDEDFSAVYCLCDRCLKKRRGIELSEMESEEISERSVKPVMLAFNEQRLSAAFGMHTIGRDQTNSSV